MFHLNSLLKEQRKISTSLLELILPQTYLATSMNDFLREKETVIPTTRRKLIGYALTGHPGTNHLVGKAMISVASVEYRQDDSLTALLQDKNGGFSSLPIKMKIHNQTDRFKSDIEQGMDQFGRWYRVDLVSFIFDPTKSPEEAELVLVKRKFNFPEAPLSSSNALTYAIGLC